MWYIWGTVVYYQIIRDEPLCPIYVPLCPTYDIVYKPCAYISNCMGILNINVINVYIWFIGILLRSLPYNVNIPRKRRAVVSPAFQSWTREMF